MEPVPEELHSSSPINANEEDERGESGQGIADGELILSSVFIDFNYTSGMADRPGRSRDIPIVIADSSPTSSPAPSPRPSAAPSAAPPKAVYSIFAPRRTRNERALLQGLYGTSSTKPYAPFPDSDTQHVQGPQTTYNVPLSQFSRRDVPSALLKASGEKADPTIDSNLIRDSPSGPESSPRHSICSADPSDYDRVASSIPPNHRTYPAISRFLERPPPSASESSDGIGEANLLWNDKWRPKRADEVLGNEQSSLYLRDWLLALKLHIHGAQTATSNAMPPDNKGKKKASKAKTSQATRGIKRPRIVRDVQRKRRRVDSEEPEDAWIADESEGEDPLDLFSVPDDESASQRLTRLKRPEVDNALEDVAISETPEQSPIFPFDNIPPFSYMPPKFGDTVYNTILLAGPPGCGKTASIYACAEELGWDVFEVYPGIGERSGAALQKLIGEVGKNHLVKQTPNTAKSQPSGKKRLDFFAKRVMSEDEAEHVQDGTTNVAQDFVDSATKPVPTEISQSIVLLEEVDILYREDTNFWPTIVKIIRECRRPVVMTCNGALLCLRILVLRYNRLSPDISLVPLRDLPLQIVLPFFPCPPPLAVSYLQVLSLSEHRLVDSAVVDGLYQGLSGENTERNIDTLLHPRQPLVIPDLRRTLTRIQLGTSISGRREPLPMNDDDQSIDRLAGMARAIELSSFADSGLRRPHHEVLRVSRSIFQAYQDVHRYDITRTC